jgi:hypothetical protein
MNVLLAFLPWNKVPAINSIARGILKTACNKFLLTSSDGIAITRARKYIINKPVEAIPQEVLINHETIASSGKIRNRKARGRMKLFMTARLK